MLGVSGCQLDFVLLIATLWDWSLASFPCRYLIHGKMIWLYVFFRQWCPMPPKNQAKLYCSPHVHQASLLRKLSELSGTINPLEFPTHAGCAVSFLSFYFPSTNSFLGARALLVPSCIHETSPFPEAVQKNPQKTRCS